MLRTYKYRIYPNSKTKKTLLSTLEICQWTYNKILALRKNTWEQEKVTISRFSCNNIISRWKQDADKEFLNSVHSQILQDVSARVDKAYKAFFRRVENGENPGFPRFKGSGYYDSFTYPQKGYAFRDNQTLYLSGIGDVKILYHRKIQGEIKTCTIRKTTTDKWFASFVCELPDIEKVSNIVSPIGIDLGLNSFVTLSNGQKVETQCFFRVAEKKLSDLHRKLSLCSKGSSERKEAKKRLALGYEKVLNQRSNLAHHVSKWLISNFDYIVFEDLNIDGMIKNHRLAKSIQDVAWNQLIQYTTYKAESAGSWIELVNPAYTSQMCSDCGNIVKKSLSERWHSCPCGCELDRDENAAINILALGLQCLDTSPRSPTV